MSDAPRPKESHGRLFIVSAPSGAGKTSLLRALMERDPSVTFSVSYTTRAPRPGEVDGRDYHFIDPERYAAMREADAFLESAQVFGNGYGTGVADVERQLAAGRKVVLEIDWQGARQVRERMPGATSVFILPPSRQCLRARLTERGTDSEATIDRRMAAATAEMAHWDEYDYVIVNDRFEQAVADLAAVLDGRGAALARTRPGLAGFAGELLDSPAGRS